jgi:iron-sulfur cluster repair protein YtfE (RIC family)
MEFNRHISRRLHEEHLATLALWSRVEASLAANRPDAPLLRSAAAALAEELDRHFAFEEAELFPRLAAAGEADIGLLLADEHATIRDVGREFMALARNEPGNPRLRPLGLELAERLVSHVQKEEMSLLPSLDDLLDEDADRELSASYVVA